MTINLEELKEEAEKLVHLLKDPHPGLFTWNKFLRQRLDAIARVSSIWKKAGEDLPKEGSSDDG